MTNEKQTTMRFLTVFLFTIYTFLLPAQERLTSIVNEVQ